MRMGEMLTLGDIKLPEGVESQTLSAGGDPAQAVVSVSAPQAEIIEEPLEEEVEVGEVPTIAEEEAAAYIKANVTKPVVGFIAGLTAPAGRRMGHAGAIISGSSGTGQSKVAAMKANGISVCENLADLGDVCADTFA